MFTSFTALNYKNLQVDNVALGKTNVLVGPNNSGKSNFLKAFGFGADIISVDHKPEKSKLQQVVDIHGGIDLPLRGGERSVQLGWGFGGTNFYQLEFSVDNFGRLSSVVEIGRRGSAPVSFQSPPLRAALSPARPSPPPFYEARVGRPDVVRDPGDKEWHREFLRLATLSHIYHVARFSHDEIISTAPRESEVSILSANASNLANALWQLDQTPDGLVPLRQRLEEGLRTLRRIWVGEGGDFRWVNLNLGGQQYSLHQVSDGTIQLLLLAYLLFGMQNVSVLAIDEPELNLHPAWLQVVGRWLQRPTSAEQVFVSTHSSDLLDTFTEGFRCGDVHLLVFDDTGKVKRVLPSDLDPLLKEGWELGDIYRVGDRSMGGWPW